MEINDKFVYVITEQKKYLSNVFRNIGFALVAPCGSILFQWIVSKNGAYFAHFLFSALSFFLGIVFMVIGYNFLEEKKSESRRI